MTILLFTVPAIVGIALLGWLSMKVLMLILDAPDEIPTGQNARYRETRERVSKTGH